MKQIFYSLFLLIGTITYGQDLYDMNTVQKIEITFAESNWDQLLDIAYASDGDYILAQSVTINGEVFDSVGVKYKGNSTYNANQTKNPFHIELDTYKDHQYGAYTDIKLSNAAKDPSFIREVLSYHILRQYMDAPLSNYANVYVNGDLLGLYSNSESVSKKFVNNRFGSKTNAFIKCSPPDGAGPQTNDYPNLVYLGQDSTDYYDSYEIKSDDDTGWQELIDLCDTLENNLESIEEILDVDRALWMIAFDNVLVNLDSYIGGFSQNYYLYRDDYGRFLPVVWDLNESFGTFSMTGSGNLNGTTAKQRMSHLLHENDADFPLIQQLLSVPMYKRMYLAHVKTMLLENFDNGSYYTKGEELMSIIDESVLADNNKFYSYANFQSNLTSDINGGGGGPGGGNSTPGIANLMDGRSDYLLGLSDFTQVQPTITNVLSSNLEPTLDEIITITAEVSDEEDVYLGYRTSLYSPFTRVLMYDDGAHNDGAVGDGVYGVDISIVSSTTDYYIYAENENIGRFSPERAQHEFYTIDLSTTAESDVVINEFMASNDVTAEDQDGDFDDWIELYNNGDEAVDLTGYYLTDDLNDLTQWSFPSGAIIEAGGYMIIWADEDLDQEGLHADFKLSSSGESIALVDPSGIVILDQIEYGDQTTDVSYGRYPNGKGDFQSMEPTFSAENMGSSVCEDHGGDADNDGICADDDCDDNDASLGAMQPEGTACDDGDSSTENDMIQSDGCTCLGTVIIESEVVINEFMASNDVTASDQDGDFDDWIELYNNGDVAVDLSGYFLSDDGSDLYQWSLPAGTIIEAGGYLIVWADEDLDQNGLHADFKLSSSGETLYLIGADSLTIDAVTYGEQMTDVSYGRYPNGTGDFQSMEPTFNAENSIMTNTNDPETEAIQMEVYPNPANQKLTIASETPLKWFTIYNMGGQKIWEESPYSNEIQVDISRYANGLYFIHAISDDGTVIREKMVVHH